MIFIKYLVLEYNDKLNIAYEKLNNMYTKSLKIEDTFYGFQFQRWLSGGGMRLNTEIHEIKRNEEQLKQVQLWWYLCLKYLYDKGYYEHLQLLFLINNSEGIIDDYTKIDLKNMGLSEWEQCFMSGKIAEVINPNNKYGNMGFIFSSTPECIGYRYWTFADYGVRQRGIPLDKRKTMATNFIENGTYESSIHFFINRLLAVFPKNSNELKSFIIKYGFRNDNEEFIKTDKQKNLQNNKNSSVYKFKKFKNNDNGFSDKQMQLIYILHPHTNNETKEGGLLACDSDLCVFTKFKNDKKIQEREEEINKLMKKKKNMKGTEAEKQALLEQLKQLKEEQTREVEEKKGENDRPSILIKQNESKAVCQEMNEKHNEKKNEEKWGKKMT